VAVVVIVTPGPDTALTIRNTLLGARRAGVFTAFGVVTGQAVWALATAIGVAALLRASEPAFTVLKLAGAAYLVYLGVYSLLAAIRRRGDRPAFERPARGLTAVAAYRQGLISNLGNPKMAAFFPSLLPQFASSFASLIALGLVFCALTLAWLTAYAVVVGKAGDVLRRSGVRRAIDAVMGGVMVVLGLRVASHSRG
jgi:threonine/homoserine/homoserine lactone efflux protein